MDKDEVQIQDNVIKRVDVEKDEDIKRADEEVMAIPQYNKPKKANNANVKGPRMPPRGGVNRLF